MMRVHNDCSPHQYVPWGNYIRRLIPPLSNNSHNTTQVEPATGDADTSASHIQRTLPEGPRFRDGKMDDRGDDSWCWARNGYDLGIYRDSSVESWKAVAAGLTNAWERLRMGKRPGKLTAQNKELLDAFRQDGTIGLALVKVFATILDKIHSNLPDAYIWYIFRMAYDCEVSSAYY